MQPDIRSSFEYDGKHILVEWYTVKRKSDIPNLDWKQVYAVGDLGGLVPLVTDWRKPLEFNLPGGKTEPGETLEDTVRREMIEECNMRVIEWEPLGYQLLTEPEGAVVPQFRVYAKLEKIGEFTADPDGNIIRNTLAPLDEVNAKIGYGDIGERLIELARPFFG